MRTRLATPTIASTRHTTTMMCGLRIAKRDMLRLLRQGHRLAPRFARYQRAGTTNTPLSTDAAMPPMMARAMGTYASPPVPSLTAKGSRPTTVAMDVISTTRKRARHASRIASRAGCPSSRSRLAACTITMLFETTTPTIITVPISDITLRLVPVTNQRGKHAGDSHRHRRQNQKRIQKRPELRHQDEVQQRHRQHQSVAEAGERLRACPAPFRANPRARHPGAASR